MKVLRICQSSPFPIILNITTSQKFNLCLTCMNQMQCNDDNDEKEKLLAARMGRKRPFWCCQHMLALAHAGVGRNTRVRANSPTTPWSVSTIILALLVKFPTVGWGTLDYQTNIMAKKVVETYFWGFPNLHLSQSNIKVYYHTWMYQLVFLYPKTTIICHRFSNWLHHLILIILMNGETCRNNGLSSP